MRPFPTSRRNIRDVVLIQLASTANRRASTTARTMERFKTSISGLDSSCWPRRPSRSRRLSKSSSQVTSTESLGQSAAGRDLRALVVGAALGGFADDLLAGLHFQTRLSYAFVQNAVDIHPNRSGIDSSIGYFLTPRFAIDFLETFQYTYDGTDWGIPPFGIGFRDGRPMTRDYGFNHDRLARSNALTVGVGATFALTERVGVFGTVSKLAWGENLAAPRSITVGMNLGFQTHRSSSRPKPNVTRTLGF